MTFRSNLHIQFSALALCVTPLLVGSVAGCGDNPPPETPPAPAATVAPPPPVATVATPTEPTAEEKKKAADAKALQEDRATWETESKAEAARWTPELKKEAKALADKAYANGKAAIQATVAGKHRVPGHKERDAFRHPVETLDFFGFKPTMTVLDIGPGDGWYGELIAPAVAKKGKYMATNGDPTGPVDQRGTLYAQRYKAFLDKAPEIYGAAETITVNGKEPKLNLENKVDLVILMRGVHGMKNQGTFNTWLGEIHKTLKPNGVLGIEQHRAPADAADEISKKGYVPEKWVIDTVEAAGFKLAGKSEVNANAKDTKDYPNGVWDLPPTLEQGAKDREKYVAIGESDRMTLKFTKVAAKVAPAAKPAAPAAKPAPKK